MKEDCTCDYDDIIAPDVCCPFHGQEALKNKTGYYEKRKNEME